ncbi:MAG: hypothetical protein U9Q94_06850 [Candidatus Bipolaricaulota bacterium]|nr:hypothetical protein [Candidatus Bipolaricaulota bacterium]
MPQTGGQFSIETLIHTVGGRFSTQLGIDLVSKESAQVFRWFLAAVLFGARISETIAINTYKEFETREVTTPQEIARTEWDGLVKILDAGGYARYDFKTATKLLGIAGKLKHEYHNDINLLHTQATDPRDLEARLLAFAGIGPITVNIFLRELRGIWEKANPPLGDLVLLAARNLGLIEKSTTPTHALVTLERIFRSHAACSRYRFADFEGALIRLGKGWCHRERHATCPMRKYCPYFQSWSNADDQMR